MHGRCCRPAASSVIEIINKQLLLQLVGYLCYWQMGFNSVFKGLIRPWLYQTIPYNTHCREHTKLTWSGTRSVPSARHCACNELETHNNSYRVTTTVNSAAMAGYAQWHWRALSLSAPCSAHSATHVPIVSLLRWNPLSTVCLMCKWNGQIDVDVIVLCEYNLVCVCVCVCV